MTYAAVKQNINFDEIKMLNCVNLTFLSFCDIIPYPYFAEIIMEEVI